MTDKPAQPLIEHEFDPGHSDPGDADADYCWAHVSTFGNGDCGQPRAAHRAEPPTAEPWMPNANPWNGARTAAGANAAVEPSRESVPVGGADIVTVESHVHLLRRFATGLAEAIHAQRARDSEIRREQAQRIEELEQQKINIHKEWNAEVLALNKRIQAAKAEGAQAERERLRPLLERARANHHTTTTPGWGGRASHDCSCGEKAPCPQVQELEGILSPAEPKEK